MTLPEIDVQADDLVAALLRSTTGGGVCIFDSCGHSNRGSQMMYAGLEPIAPVVLSGQSARSLQVLDGILTGDKPTVFTLSYDFGRKLQQTWPESTEREPDVFIAKFEGLIAYDYTAQTLTAIAPRLSADRVAEISRSQPSAAISRVLARSNFTKQKYLAAVEEIKEHIRRGDTYQTNLTQKITVPIPEELTAAEVFARLRRDHPAPFMAYIERPGSTVVSASPERFFRVTGRRIESSPIKGTRPRGKTPDEDAAFRSELLTSEKDRAENTMIVDLMRNDLGRVCEFGSVAVRERCALQELPTLFHLVSTVEGQLREETRPSDILRSLFPCGSITGAPKIRTMQIIDEIEPDRRGLSMGAIGIYIPEGFGLPPVLDVSVAIRTMVIREGTATFNVGGGIVIDSDPEAEYDESLLKARALLDALGAFVDDIQSSSTAGEQFETSAV